MNRRTFRRWAAWLLPLLALRAFLPVGFMLSADAEGLALEFCRGQAPVLVQLQHSGAAAEHVHHHAPHAAHHGGSHAQLDSPCPYATAAVGLAFNVPPAGIAALPITRERVQPLSIFLTGAGPLRADRIRGPPSFS